PSQQRKISRTGRESSSNKAGPATALTTPGTTTVTPINLLNGSATYNYRVIAEDRSGGLTAASTAGGTTAGVATLGSNSVVLTTCARTNGVATYTSSSAHNLPKLNKLSPKPSLASTTATPSSSKRSPASRPTNASSPHHNKSSEPYRNRSRSHRR